jgi:hypothetical protein
MMAVTGRAAGHASAEEIFSVLVVFSFLSFTTTVIRVRLLSFAIYSIQCM